MQVLRGCCWIVRECRQESKRLGSEDDWEASAVWKSGDGRKQGGDTRTGPVEIRFGSTSYTKTYSHKNNYALDNLEIKFQLSFFI